MGLGLSIVGGSDTLLVSRLLLVRVDLTTRVGSEFWNTTTASEG